MQILWFLQGQGSIEGGIVSAIKIVMGNPLLFLLRKYRYFAA